MGSQLIPNAVRRFFLAMVLTALLTGSVAEAASYQKKDRTIVDPILDRSGVTHSHSGANLEPGADLTYANLLHADLTGANLTDADLTGASLNNANLTGAILHNADLTDALLRSANLTGANLRYANLTSADLYYADLYYATLYYATLYYATLYYATLYYATLYYATLYYATLYYATLYYATLYYATLYYATLYYATLSDTNLDNTWLHYADLSGADLTGADLYSVDLTGAWGVEISTGSPYYYRNTLLPFGFDPVAHGWTLAPYCDFTPDAACDLADINQMFQAGNLVTGVTTSGSTDRLDLVDNDTIDAADITEWLAQAATANGHGSPYLRGDTELDRDVDITDFNTLAANVGSRGAWPVWDEGNFNGDGDTDITDFNLLAANFSPSGYATSAIREPSTMLLASLALILVGVSFRFSKNG